METKRNLKYFTSQGVSPLLIVSLALLAVGVILCIIAGRDTTMLMVGILVALVGLIVLMFSSSGKSNELDIDATCQALTKDLIEQSTKRFEVYERSYLRMIHPIEFRAYQFTDDSDLLMKKAADGQVRSNYFSGLYMFFTNDNAYFYRQTFSVTDEEKHSVQDFKIPYAKFDSVVLEENPVTYMQGKKEKTYMDYKFIVNTTDGEAFRMSVMGGADVDKAVSDMNHLIAVKHANPTDRLATEGGKYATAKNF